MHSFSEFVKIGHRDSELGIVFHPVDVLGDGNCAIRSILLRSMIFPYSSHFECRTRVVQWAATEGRTFCSLAYRLFGDCQTSTYDNFLDEISKDRSYVGTVFYYFVSMLHCVDIIIYNPNGDRESTRVGLERVLKRSLSPSDWTALDYHMPGRDITYPSDFEHLNTNVLYVYHHQYHQPLRRHQGDMRSRYNHYCALLYRGTFLPLANPSQGLSERDSKLLGMGTSFESAIDVANDTTHINRLLQEAHSIQEKQQLSKAGSPTDFSSTNQSSITRSTSSIGLSQSSISSFMSTRSSKPRQTRRRKSTLPPTVRKKSKQQTETEAKCRKIMFNYLSQVEKNTAVIDGLAQLRRSQESLASRYRILSGVVDDHTVVSSILSELVRRMT